MAITEVTHPSAARTSPARMCPPAVVALDQLADATPVLPHTCFLGGEQPR